MVAVTSLEHLLPEPDQSVRCADFARGLVVDPGGTAIRADRVVLIEVPLPWPKPVFDHPELIDVAPILKASTTPTRTLAYVGGSNGARAGHSVLVFDRAAEPEPTVIERRYDLASTEDLMALATALATDDEATADRMASHRSQLDTPVVLICTQGSHDICCGSEGARFAAEAETIAELRVFRVSHTGGHRFAPTAMTLPDGRMWADMDLDMLRQILARTGDPADLVDRCRGWWGADVGPAQVAERAVFSEVGWDLEDQDRTVEAELAFDGATQVAVVSGRQTWNVAVSVGRTVPTIACRRPGGLPAKQSVEYLVQRIVAD